MNTKRCTKCLETKSIERFSLARQGVKGPVYRSNCKECQAAAARIWLKNNKEQTAVTKRTFNLKKNYNMTPKEYDDMMESQSGVCGICGNAESALHSNGTPYRLSVDHCHTTGEVRGLLCHSCNRAIGLLKDNVDVLRKAIDYLKGND